MSLTYRNTNDGYRCAVCHTPAQLLFYWYPMCDMHRTKAYGLHAWVQAMCKRVYSQEEQAGLATEVQRFMRLEWEQTR